MALKAAASTAHADNIGFLIPFEAKTESLKRIKSEAGAICC